MSDFLKDFLNTVQPLGNFLKPKPPVVETVTTKPSINAETVNVGGFDPIQGYDVGVFVTDLGSKAEVLLGQFTSIEVAIKAAAEPYKAIGYNIPIYLDGEIQINFTLEKGLLDINVLEETLGFSKFSYKNSYFRTPRLEIKFMVDPVDAYALGEPTRGVFGYSNQKSKENIDVSKRVPAGQFVLRYAKIEDWMLGSRAGKQVVVTQWRGVAQEIEVIRPDKIPSKPEVKSKTSRETETFYFNGFADFATTTKMPQMGSYQLYPDWVTPESILRFLRTIIPDQTAKLAIDRQLAQVNKGLKSFAKNTKPAIVTRTPSKAINTEIKSIKFKPSESKNNYGSDLNLVLAALTQQINIAPDAATKATLQAMYNNLLERVPKRSKPKDPNFQPVKSLPRPSKPKDPDFKPAKAQPRPSYVISLPPGRMQFIKSKLKEVKVVPKTIAAKGGFFFTFPKISPNKKSIAKNNSGFKPFNS